jgi:tRNA(Ile)-lysidine synthase
LMKAIGQESVRRASRHQLKAHPRSHQRLSRFAGALLKEWKRLALPLKDGGIVVAVSGGADSVAVLLALSELLQTSRLALRLTVAHLDHGLRGAESASDALWVEALAAELGFKFEFRRARVKERATAARDNLEQAARRSRYEFLKEVAEKCEARLVITAHTMDDQAETILMRLLRGSGAEGLSGMELVRPLSKGSEILLARPLLNWARRALTENYCREREVEFRVDAMNEDERFSRVRVRRQLLPLLETFNPKVVEALARAALLLREDAGVLNGAAEWALKSASEEVKNEEGQGSASIVGSLRVDVLRLVSAPIRRRALRLWLARGRGDLRRLELVHLSGVEKLIEGERGGRVAELPGGAFVERKRGRLFLKSRSRNEQQNPEVRSQNSE